MNGTVAISALCLIFDMIMQIIVAAYLLDFSKLKIRILHIIIRCIYVADWNDSCWCLFAKLNVVVLIFINNLKVTFKILIKTVFTYITFQNNSKVIKTELVLWTFYSLILEREVLILINCLSSYKTYYRYYNIVWFRCQAVY